MKTRVEPERASGDETPDRLMRMLLPKRGRAAVHCLLGITALALLTLVCFRFHVNPTAVAFLYLIVIVSMSLTGGFVPPALVSTIAILCLDYFFTPPLFRFAMNDPRDVVALIAYFTTAFVINRLVSKTRRSFREIQTLKDQLRLVVDTTPAMVHSAQPDGSLDFFNQRWLDYLGASLDEIKDWRWTSKIHPEDVEAFVEKWRSSVRTGDDFEAEARVRRADGTYRWMLHRKVPSRDVRGNIIKWYGSSLDIEDRKWAEEKVRSNERELRTTIETIPTFIGTALPDGSVDFVSQKWLDYTGLSREQWLDSGWMTVTHPEDLGRAVEKWNAARAAGEPIEQEQRIRQADGTYRWFLGRNVPLRNADGKIVKWYGTLHDIDDRKSAEDALRRTENFLAQAVRIARVGVWVVKPPDIPEYWSPIAFEIFGIDPAKGPPQNLEEYLLHVHPDDRERLSRETEAILAQGQIFEYKYRIVRPDGAIRVIREVGSPIRENGVVTRYVGAWMDITEEEERIDKLRCSEAYMAQAQHIARVGSWSYSPQAKCEHWSEEMFRIFGFDPSKGYPANDAFALHPDDRQRGEEELACMFKDGQVLDTKYRYFRPDGEMRVIRDVGAPVFENGIIVRFVGACMDITEEEQRIDQLRNSEAFLAEVQRVARVGSWAWEPPDNLEHFSPVCYEIFGRDPAEGIPQSPREFFKHAIHPEDYDRVMKAADDLQASGKVSELKYRIIRPNAEVRVVREVGVPFRENGIVTRYVGSLMDITDQELLTQELQQNDFYLSEGQRLAHVGSWSFNPEGICDYWSRELYAILGFDPTKGTPTIADYLKLVHPQDREFVEGTINRMISKGEGCDVKKRIVRPDGKQRVIRCVGIPVRENGVVARFIGTLMDITEQELMTQELRRREAFLTEAQRLSHTGSFGWSVTTDEHFWSGETFRIFEYEPSVKITLKLIRERIHPQDIPLFQQVVASAADGKDFNVGFCLLMPSGSLKHVHVVAHAVREESGNIDFIGAVMDVTDRMRAEEAVRRSEAFLAEGQRLSHTGSWCWNVSTGALVWSREKFRLLGLDFETTNPSFELFWERVHPEDRQRLKQAFDSAVLNKTDFEQEYRIVTPDWIIRHLHDVGHAVFNETNELVEFIGSVMDITDRKRAEERAQSHNEAIRLALNAFVEELDVNRFLGHVISGLTKQFQAVSSELWLFDDSSSTPALFMACQQGKVVSAETEGKNGLQPGGIRTTWEPSNVGRIPRIIEIPAQESLLGPAHLESLKHQGIKTLAVVPLVIGEQNLGFFELRFQVATRFTPDDLDLAQALVHHATLALQLSRLAHRTEQMAVTEERNRLAREIHDTLAQAFAGIVLHSEALGGSLGVNKQRSAKSLSHIQKLARLGLDEARRSVQALRPKALEGSTLSEALEQATKRLSDGAKLSCNFKQQGETRMLSTEAQNELFRIAQEAMTNVTKHSHAKSVWINLEFDAKHVILTVRDDGVGFAATNSTERKRGYGLVTMRERAQRIGGRLEIENPDNGGTTIRVLVSLAEEAKP
jgi:PAS domain S-box-containing protein